MKSIIRNWVEPAVLAMLAITFMAVLSSDNVVGQMVNNNGASPSPGLGLYVTSSPQTVDLSGPKTSLSVCNATSTDTQPSQTSVFVLPSCCGASPIPTAGTGANGGDRLAIGQCGAYKFTDKTEQSATCTKRAYCQVSITAYPSPSPTPKAFTFISAQ